MKFRDPKTGEVFAVAHGECAVRFCRNISCSGCPVKLRADAMCSDWVNKNPYKAAHLMGYEVVEMERMDKPRICEVLGVEVDEEWRVTGNDMATYRVNEDGELVYAMPLYSRPGHGKWSSAADHLAEFINHPDRIIRKPRFTEEEVAALRMFATAYPEGVIERCGLHDLSFRKSDDCPWDELPAGLFPSLRTGQAVTLKNVIGTAD